MIHYFRNVSTITKLILMIGILLYIPLIVLIFYPEEKTYFTAFFYPATASVILGLILGCFPNKYDKNLLARLEETYYSSSIVLFIWLYGILLFACPFILANKLTVVQALFESASGWTTTGLSVMDVSKTEHIFLFLRSFMQYCGGLGFIMIMLLLLSTRKAMNLFNAEGHPDKLLPNLVSTSRTIFLMYNLFLVLGVTAYAILGMPIFDGLCHAMCALSTGGFSTQLNSIGQYQSLPIEMVTIILMIIGCTNFAVLLLLIKGKLKRFWQVSEIKLMAGIFFIFSILISINLSSNTDLPWVNAWRISFFNLVSALSTTGYSTVDYSNWPSFSFGLMIITMLIGGGLGSTAGGIKLNRICIFGKLLWSNIQKRFSSPLRVNLLYYYRAEGKVKIHDYALQEAVTYIGVYLLTFVAGTMLLCLSTNADLQSAMFEFASALGTVGLSIGLTNSSSSNFTLIVEICGMLLGRLEIFLVLIGLYGIFYQSIRSKISKLMKHAPNKQLT